MTRVPSIALGAALALVCGAAIAGDIDTPNTAARCGVPPALMVIQPPEARIANRIVEHKPLTIVAMGSSSTQGVGASAPGLSYPSRLASDLKDRFPAIDIRVVNRGKGGEDVTEELARLDRDVIAEHPELVIWQVGTNAVLRRDDLSADGKLIEEGVGQLKAGGSEVVLMDLQYAPRVLARPAYALMEQLIAAAAEHTRVGLFRRFDIMRYWQSEQQGDTSALVGPDGLHMTDRSYGCLALELADALAGNWQGQKRAVPPAFPPAARVAGLAGPHHSEAPPADATR